MRYLSTAILTLITINLLYPYRNHSIDEDVEIHTRHSHAPFAIDTSNIWVDSVFKSLTIRERIGQLMMISAYSNMGEEHVKTISQQIKKYNIGGVIFMKGSPLRQARLTNHLQSISKIPLLIAIDGEWGLSMRLDSVKPFPRQMMLGAITDESLIYDMGAEIARQCRRMGIHINFAPVVDINNNPLNPVINSRSFGENKKQVLRYSYAYMTGMQDNGLLVTAKHFPGHGDTEIDSHYGLPTITHNRNHLENNELYPFRHLIQMGLTGIMVAHINVPALNNTTPLPATLSSAVVTQLLKNKYEFKGLVFTDAMNMGGITNSYQPDQAALLAFEAGNDIILFPPDIEKAIERLETAANNNEIDINEINRRCKKILGAKYYANLNKYQPIDTTNLINDLTSERTEYLNQAMASEALTLVSNKNNLLPLKSTESPLHVINIEATDNSTFIKRLKHYSKVKTHNITAKVTIAETDEIEAKAERLPYVVIAWHKLSLTPAKNYGATPQTIELINRLAKKTKVILVVFGNPYILNNTINNDHINTTLITYEDNHYTQDYAAQLIFGGIESKGKLPVTTGIYTSGTCIKTSKTRLGYIHPKALGVDMEKLSQIDTLMTIVIKEKMAPGAQILCTKNGYVFYNKHFGYHTYDSMTKVSHESIYDLASLTKVLVTTPLIMHLYDNKRLSLTQTLSTFIRIKPEKSDITIYDMLTHQAGFKAWIPFYKQMLDDSLQYKPEYYSTTDTGRYIIPIAHNLFTTPETTDTIYNIIDTTPLNPNKDYLYSDISFYYLTNIIEQIENKEIDYLIDSILYKPLGIDKLKYQPLKHFDISSIVPTEHDTVFRKQLIHGYVHDQGCALMGGKCGHAGLFGNATDIAKFGQMLLNKGSYGNKHYFDKSTVDYFTSTNNPENNRRGLGFDKPERRKNIQGPTFNEIPAASYGHSGFTGTYLWIDPCSQIVYVFLSNRIYPDAGNNKLVRQNIRTRIHKILYDALNEKTDTTITENLQIVK